VHTVETRSNLTELRWRLGTPVPHVVVIATRETCDKLIEFG